MTRYRIRDIRTEDINHLINVVGAAYDHNKDPARWPAMEAGVRMGKRLCVVAEEEGVILGICSLIFESDYEPFCDANIPEVNALDVIPTAQRRGIATAIITHLEERARGLGYKTIGIGTGLFADYGPAQRLYIKMGYVPDGRGITYGGDRVAPGAMIRIDDEATLWMTKELPA